MYMQGAIAHLIAMLALASAHQDPKANAEVEATGGICPHVDIGEHEFINFLQAELQTSQGERAGGLVRFFLGQRLKQSVHQHRVAMSIQQAPVLPQQAPALPVVQQPVLVPSASDSIPQSYFQRASKDIANAGMSTPMPAAALINAPPPKPTPLPWDDIYQDPSQPLNTKFGSAVMSALGGSVTPTPPPSQAATDMQFVADCPLVLFNQNLAIRAPSCNNTHGRWVDPNPLNPRTVLRWEPLQAGGVRLGVDSALAGKGAALFANILEDFTLSSYEFTVKNCLGVERYILEEQVYKVDNIGRASSTVDIHDVSHNSVAYFFRYAVKLPTGTTVAQSTLYRMDTQQRAMQVNFTEFKDDMNTGKLLAVATKQGQWEKDGWEECMSKSSPRGWNLYFPDTEKKANKTSNHATLATVQDVRVAIAAAITIMAHRDETRGSDGLNTESSKRQSFMLAGIIALFIMGFLLMTNFYCMFVGSGMKAKLKKIMYDSEGALLPKKPFQTRAPALTTTW